MPWHIGAKGSHGCSGYPVIKDSDNSVAGCHKTKKDANAQLAALYANEKSAKLPHMAKTRLGIQEHRLARVGQIRAIEDGGQVGRFAARVMQYNVLDDYKTEFAPGVFNESMAEFMPRITWGHDWHDPLGRWIAYEETDGKYLDLVGQLDDFEAVPRARQAYAQLQSGTISQFSVGFMPLAYERDNETDIITFTRARLDEVALVIVGAVPGTELLALRNRPRINIRSNVLTLDAATSILVKLSQGELDLTDALVQVKEQAVAVEELEGDEGDPPPADPPADPPAAWTEEQLAMWPDGDPPEDWDGVTPPETGELDPPAAIDPELAAEAEAALALVASA